MHAPDRHELNAGWMLPRSYGVDRLVLMPCDPHKLFTYWEITPQLEKEMSAFYPGTWEMGRTMLKLLNLDTGNEEKIAIEVFATSWYLDVTDADQSYQAHLGRELPDGTFATMLTSNTVRTPRDSLSSVIDPRWRMFAFWQHRYNRKIMCGYSSYDIFPAKQGAKEVQSE
ncbi:MAG: DUF4912 domain-containing protein [Firmicutes bacterium]|nr:DUF4912 domain-containing protein [Bacillota bacterium]